jgi:1-acyl-sn-glycerol-3-phosphate acyltransferase
MLVLASIVFFVSLPIALQFRNESFQKWLFSFYCRAFLASWGGKIRRHGRKPTLSKPHIFVSNHTSVIDYVILSSHGTPHATVAQKHSGMLGFFLGTVLTLNGSVLFNRNEKKDRELVANKYRV